MFTIFALIALVALLPACSQNAQTGERNSMEGRPVVSAADPSVVVTATPDSRVTGAVKIKCKAEELEVQEFRNAGPNRDEIRIVRPGGTILYTLKMPSVDDFQNFGTGPLVPSNDGFDVSVDWGSRIYHEVTFSFACREDELRLSTIKHSTLDKHDPENDAKSANRTISVKPDLSMRDVVVGDFLTTLHENPKWSGKISEMKRSK